MKKNTITITEYGNLFVYEGEKREIVNSNGKFVSSPIDRKSFEILKDFNYKNEDEIFTVTRFVYSGKRYDALRAKSYVGVIELRNGLFIEILPKIYLGTDKDDLRGIFLKMLSKLRNSPFKEFGSAHLLYKNFPLLEVFVMLFINSVYSLVKRGLRGDYTNIEDNEKFLKGKLLFSEHTKKNIVHKERFYVSYDEFSINSHANRLIKTTILYLLKKRFSFDTERKLRQLLFIFDEIDVSENIDSDFQKAETKMRLFKDYEKVLSLCKIFLNRESFTNYKGKEYATAILFSMEKIFEDYIAYLVKKNIDKSWNIRIQYGREHLLVYPNKFSLKPDIFLKKDNNTIIIDTKWKLLDKFNDKDFGISQSDLYQMYAYAKKYNAKKIILLYPYNENFPEGLCNHQSSWKFEDNISLNICSADLGKVVYKEKEVLKDIYF